MTDDSRSDEERFSDEACNSRTTRKLDPGGREAGAPEIPVPDEFLHPVVLEVTDVLDLHSVTPRDTLAVVEEYLQECYRLNLTAIRIIHGRGIGVQRELVRKVLERTEFVLSYQDAPMESGGWGATVATLRRRPSC